MPCDCELDLARRWVRARGWGVITYDEAVATRLKFTSDPNFQPDFCQIYDGREITRVSLTASEVGALSAADPFGPRSRRAFVAPRRDTYELARMYQIYRKLNSGTEEIKLFRTVAEAEVWLSESTFRFASIGT